MFARVPDKGNNRVREEQEHVRSTLDCDTQMTGNDGEHSGMHDEGGNRIRIHG